MKVGVTFSHIEAVNIRIRYLYNWKIKPVNQKIYICGPPFLLLSNRLDVS